MSANLILRGVIIPVVYMGIGFASAIFYDKYKNDTQNDLAIENINNINKFNKFNKFNDIDKMKKDDE